jgi:6-phosphogluconate dehydrogenase
MQLGMVALGRVVANIVRRLLRNGHKWVVFDRSPKATKRLLSSARSREGV